MPRDNYLEIEYPAPSLRTEISPGIVYAPDAEECRDMLESGRVVSAEDFRLAGDALCAPKGTATYTFGSVAYIFVDRFGDPRLADEITSRLFYGALNRYNTAWAKPHLLLETQKLQELAEAIERGERINGIAQKSHRIISMVLRDDLSLVEV
jgi:hypothetical protein